MIGGETNAQVDNAMAGPTIALTIPFEAEPLTSIDTLRTSNVIPPTAVTFATPTQVGKALRGFRRCSKKAHASQRLSNGDGGRWRPTYLMRRGIVELPWPRPTFANSPRHVRPSGSVASDSLKEWDGAALPDFFFVSSFTRSDL